MRLFRRRRPRARVEITCPHGAFIPATYDIGSPGDPVHKLSCDKCHFLVKLYWVWPENVV